MLVLKPVINQYSKIVNNRPKKSPRLPELLSEKSILATYQGFNANIQFPCTTQVLSVNFTPENVMIFTYNDSSTISVVESDNICLAARFSGSLCSVSITKTRIATHEVCLWLSLQNDIHKRVWKNFYDQEIHSRKRTSATYVLALTNLINSLIQGGSYAFASTPYYCRILQPDNLNFRLVL